MFLGFKGSDTNATKGDSSALTSLSVLDFGLTTPKQHDEEVNTYFVFNVCNAVVFKFKSFSIHHLSLCQMVWPLVKSWLNQ